MEDRRPAAPFKKGHGILLLWGPDAANQDPIFIPRAAAWGSQLAKGLDAEPSNAD